MRTLFAGRRGDQCIIFRDLGSTDPAGGGGGGGSEDSIVTYIINGCGFVLRLTDSNLSVYIDLFKL